MSGWTLAHAGHWLVQLAYLSPLGALAIMLVVGKLRERRERRSGVGAQGPEG